MKSPWFLVLAACAGTQHPAVPADPPPAMPVETAAAAPVPAPAPPAAAPAMDEATLVAKSHAWLDTYDRFDIPGFTEPLGPTFILYEEARFVDKDSLAKNLQHKNDDHSPPRTRTWSDDYGVAKWDLVTMIYEGTNPARIEKVKPALKKGGLFVLEYFHVDSDIAKTGAGGAKDGELAAEFKDGFKILRDESVEDVADWSLRKTKLVRFVAQKL